MNSTKVPPPLAAFVRRWLMRVVPGLREIRIEHCAGGRSMIRVRDTIGWRDVGPLKTYEQIARALGRIQ